MTMTKERTTTITDLMKVIAITMMIMIRKMKTMLMKDMTTLMTIKITMSI